MCFKINPPHLRYPTAMPSNHSEWPHTHLVKSLWDSKYQISVHTQSDLGRLWPCTLMKSQCILSCSLVDGALTPSFYTPGDKSNNLVRMYCPEWFGIWTSLTFLISNHTSPGDPRTRNHRDNFQTRYNMGPPARNIIPILPSFLIHIYTNKSQHTELILKSSLK